MVSCQCLTYIHVVSVLSYIKVMFDFLCVQTMTDVQRNGNHSYKCACVFYKGCILHTLTIL